MTGRRIIRIGEKAVGDNQPVFVIAEAGVNHNGKLSFARKLIDVAAKAGADAVKFQTFSPDELVTKSAAKAAYQIRNEMRGKNLSTSQTRVLPLGKGESQHAMLKLLQLPREWHAVLKQYAEKKGLLFLSTPFSLNDAKFLRSLGVAAIKVGSSDANNFPYLRRIAAWGLPLILSTGMADMKEIREAVRVIKKAGNRKLIILHCTTNYPTPSSEANVRAIQTLQKEFGSPVGFSDHTVGSEAAVAAVALGACVIEKHFTLNRNLSGPDHKASMEPEKLKEFVRRIRGTEAALGSGKKVPCRSEKEIAKVARKSIVTLRAIKKGERFTEDNTGVKRPGVGLQPRYYDMILGARAAKDIIVDTLIQRQHILR